MKTRDFSGSTPRADRQGPLGRHRSVMITLLTCLSVAGCVITTYERPGDPPRVATPAPALGDPGSSNSAEASTSGGPAGSADVQDPGGPTAITAAHLLVMYAGSQQAPSSIVRTKAEARKRAEEALARARTGEDFAKLAGEYSDEPGAGVRGGSLGRFSREDMVKPFSDAAFRLGVGEISPVVETDFGFHVIKRTQ